MPDLVTPITPLSAGALSAGPLAAGPALPAVLAGLGLGLSLIVAIGAQNAFVLRQGLLGEHVAAVVAVCIGSDLLLIVAGIGGAGAALTDRAWLVNIIRIIGAAFLLGYGVLAARRAWRPKGLDAGGADLQAGPDGRTDRAGLSGLTGPTGRSSLLAAVATSLALTWLNPHVYLDTVFLLGSIASTHGAQHWWFGFGAMIGSVLWFLVLGFGARFLRPAFARPSAWRVLDALIALVMTGIAVSLAAAAV